MGTALTIEVCLVVINSFCYEITACNEAKNQRAIEHLQSSRCQSLNPIYNQQLNSFQDTDSHFLSSIHPQVSCSPQPVEPNINNLFIDYLIFMATTIIYLAWLHYLHNSRNTPNARYVTTTEQQSPSHKPQTPKIMSSIDDECKYEPLTTISEKDNAYNPITLYNGDKSKQIQVDHYYVLDESDPFDGSNMLGIVLYQYHGKSEWVLNGVKCKAGCIYLANAEAVADVDIFDPEARATMHEKCYKRLFDVELNYNAVVGAGFAYKDKDWRWVSITMNGLTENYRPTKSDDHDENMVLSFWIRNLNLYMVKDLFTMIIDYYPTALDLCHGDGLIREMHDIEKRIVYKAVAHWISTRQRHLSVFDYLNEDDYCIKFTQKNEDETSIIKVTRYYVSDASDYFDGSDMVGLVSYNKWYDNGRIYLKKIDNYDGVRYSSKFADSIVSGFWYKKGKWNFTLKRLNHLNPSDEEICGPDRVIHPMESNWISAAVNQWISSNFVKRELIIRPATWSWYNDSEWIDYDEVTNKCIENLYIAHSKTGSHKTIDLNWGEFVPRIRNDPYRYRLYLQRKQNSNFDYNLPSADEQSEYFMKEHYRSKNTFDVRRRCKSNANVLCEISDLLGQQIEEITAGCDFDIKLFAKQILGRDDSPDIGQYVADNLLTQCPKDSGDGDGNSHSHGQAANPGVATTNSGNHKASSQNGGNGNDDSGEDHNRDEKKDDDKKKPTENGADVTTSRKGKFPKAVLKAQFMDEHSEWVTFDASGSMDANGDPCTHFVFDFGDKTPPILITSPIISRSYLQSGIYEATLIVTDKYGQQSRASIQLNMTTPNVLIVSQPPPTSTSSDTADLLAKIQELSMKNQRLVRCYKSAVNVKSDKKRKPKNKQLKAAREPNYNPPASFGVVGNIKISKKMTEEVIPCTVNVAPITRLYRSYMNKLTALQWKDQDDSKYNIGDVKVLDYDFHDEKSGESLYCLIKKQRSSSYKWIMDEKLYNKLELQKMKNVAKIPCLRSDTYVISLMKSIHQMEAKIKQDLNRKIAKTAMNKFTVYNKQNVKKDDEIIWPLRYEKFKEYCNNNKNWKCIPILMSYDNIENGVQYLVIVETEATKPDIGISVKPSNGINSSLFVTGIHLDKSSILEQHQLAMPYPHNESCNCLDSLNDNTNITHLIIGDKNHYKHETERLRQKLHDRDALISSMMNANQFDANAPSTPTDISLLSSSSQYDVQGYSQFTMSPPSSQRNQKQCNK